MKQKLFIVAALCLLATGMVQAQYNATNNLFYNSFRMPQSNQLNPAFFPTRNSFYLQLPSAGFKFGSPLALQDVVHVQGDTATVIDINNMLDALTDNNRLITDIDANIFGFGFKANNLFITLNTQLKANVTFGLPVSIINTLRNGNVDENGNAINEVSLVGGDLLSTQAYLELSLGGGYHFAPIGLTVGAHAKLLYGIANVNLDNTNTVIRTTDNFESIDIDAYYQIQAATAVPLDSGSTINVSELLDVFHANTGLSFDLGARYDMGPFTFSFSILDLSAGIHWTRNVRTYEPTESPSHLSFSGVEIANVFNGGSVNTDSIMALFNEFIDGLKPKNSTEEEGFWYGVPTRINLGAAYNFAKIMRVGLLFHGQFDRGLLSKTNTSAFGQKLDIPNTFRFNTTVSYGINLFNWMELMFANSIVYDGAKMNFLSPGVGLVFTPATALQVYVMADYVSSIRVVEAKAFNVRLGLNLLFGSGGSSWVTLN